MPEPLITYYANGSVVIEDGTTGDEIGVAIAHIVKEAVTNHGVEPMQVYPALMRVASEEQ